MTILACGSGVGGGGDIQPETKFEREKSCTKANQRWNGRKRKKKEIFTILADINTSPIARVKKTGR
jgi:hypothetical protein